MTSLPRYVNTAGERGKEVVASGWMFGPYVQPAVIPTSKYNQVTKVETLEDIQKIRLPVQFVDHSFADVETSLMGYSSSPL